MQADNQRTVLIKVFGGLRTAFGAGSMAIPIEDGTTLSQLMAQLDSMHSELVARLREGLADGYLNVLVNGRNTQFLERMDTRLHYGDTVAFLPPVGGG